ncbi:surface protease GP63 [Trypanosoma cruzi]|nr:surface protease GP63 [Trypanosoma cruzi]
MHIAVGLNALFAVHAGSCVWRLLSSSVGMKRREEEGARSPSPFSCGFVAPRVTALSWAPCSIESGMAVNLGFALLLAGGALARVAVVAGACSVCVEWWLRCFGHFPGAVEMSWVEMVVDAVSWCVNRAAGPAALSSCCLLSLSLSRCIRCAPSISL